jgi:hypothetical protein
MDGLEIGITILFAIDMFVTFISAYETSEGEIETRLYKIVNNYLRGSFLIDLVSTFPLDFILQKF